jgi:hypothetical protein
MRFIQLVGFMCLVACANVYAQAGFVALPKVGNVQSAYVLCNPTGEYGLSAASAPNEVANNACAVSNSDLLTSPTNAPLDGFRLVGMMVSDVEIPKPDVGKNPDVAVLTDAIWRNKENTECILGTHLQMKDSPLNNGQYWEVNDIARAGFAGKQVSIAYYHKLPAAEIGGGAEVLFRAGRTFTSVKTNTNNKLLPSIEGAPASNTPINEKNAAAFSENWVNFTTDLSFKDHDNVTRRNSSIFYIKYACDAQDPVSKPDAIRFRTTGQSGQAPREIAAPGLVPIDGAIDKY